MNQVDALVVGAGVVGLAAARALARAGLETVVVDEESSFGSATSSRNSEVIHAGLYYPSGSLKARLCVRGRDLLYKYCDTARIPHRRVGKVIFAATSEQSSAIDAIVHAAETAGVVDLVRLEAGDVRRIEPMLVCHEALLSPSTGIIDSHAFMTALLVDIEDAGGVFASRTKVTRLSHIAGGWGVHLDHDPDATLVARRIVNAAGLNAHVLAGATEGLASQFVPMVHYARGVYFTYEGRTPFRHLIYPVPVQGGLGTHLTLDLAGAARFGPDVEWIDCVDYRVDPRRGRAFLEAARLIWRDIEADRLVPGYAGIRPKLSGPGQPAADFAIEGPEHHGLGGIVNLFGIESPGLTASLAIADEILGKFDLAYGA